MKKILIIEDDHAIREGLKDSLIEEHFEVIMAEDGETGYKMAQKEKLDLILLDLLLPEKNGIDICKDLRKSNISTPIIMLTCKKEELDKVLGLEIGADDYVTKPFSTRELLARIKALLRRNVELIDELQESKFGDVFVDFTSHTVIKNKVKLEFSFTELKILKYFIQHEGIVVSRHQLLDDVWGYDNYPSTRTVDNFILSIRKKIEKNPSEPKHLLTIHKAGYKFVK